jgi:hypothetical protein
LFVIFQLVVIAVIYAVYELIKLFTLSRVMPLEGFEWGLDRGDIIVKHTIKLLRLLPVGFRPMTASSTSYQAT